MGMRDQINPLNSELNPICHLLALLVFFFFFRRYNFNSLNVLTFSTYNFQFLRSSMQLVEFFIFSF
jgi:hypothetical protein